MKSDLPGWCVATFRELIDDQVLEVGDGYRAKNSELGGDGVIFLRAGHVTDTHIEFDGVDRFGEGVEGRVESKMARLFDVVVTTKGNSTGRVAFVDERMPPFVYSPHLSYWRAVDIETIDPHYLRQWSRGREFHDQLAGLKASTDMAPYLSLRDQHRLRITLPPVETQRRIAAVLGALDDRIEVNRRMNRTLEAIAQALFRRRFVDFDGRDDLVEHETGPLPVGWRWGQISDLADLNPEKWTKRTAPEYIRYLTLTDVNWGDYGEPEGMAYADAPSRARRVLRYGDTIYGRVRPGNGSYTLVQDPEPDMTGSTGFVVLRPKHPEATHFVYLWSTAPEAVEYFSAVADGSAYPAVPPDVIYRYTAPIPPVDVLAEFDEVGRPMFERISANRRHSRTLAALRDVLLPKLVSGELRVPEAQEVVSEVA